MNDIKFIASTDPLITRIKLAVAIGVIPKGQG
jgi:hypothetical protein